MHGGKLQITCIIAKNNFNDQTQQHCRAGLRGRNRFTCHSFAENNEPSSFTSFADCNYQS